MDTDVSQLFERCERCFNRSLDGKEGMDETAALYAAEFIAASPDGVMVGKNDDRLRQVMAQGFARYRAMGTKAMRMSDGGSKVFGWLSGDEQALLEARGIVR